MSDLDLSVLPPEAPEVDRGPTADDPDAPFEAIAGDPDHVELPATVDPALVRTLLIAVGNGAGAIAGNPHIDDHWHFEDDELDILAGHPGAPGVLTAWINRNPRMARAAQRGEMLIVLTTFGGYLARNVMADKAVNQMMKGDQDGFSGEARDTRDHVAAPS